jgi:hypothetical protein
MAYVESGTVRIVRHANGYEMTARDPDAVKANRARDKFKYDDPKRPPYREETITMVFTDKAKLLKAVGTAIDKLEPEADYETSFASACIAEDD